jgi:ABC-type transport system involved in cytochrome c biogenesis permease subunit
MKLMTSTALVALLAANAIAQEVPRRAQPWEPRTLELAATLPVQDQGRVKPLGTFASFKLLQLNGSRTFRWKKEGIELTPTEWLLDCLFFPEQAQDYPCFQLQTWEVADAIHVDYDREGENQKSKRDRFSYRELVPGRDELMKKATKIQHEERDGIRDPKNRTYLEAQLLQLADKVETFERLGSALTFARAGYLASAMPESAAPILGPAKELRFTGLLRHEKQVFDAFVAANGGKLPAQNEEIAEEAQPLAGLLSTAEQMGRGSAGLSLFPATDPKEREWLSVYDLFRLRLTEAPVRTDRQLEAAIALEDAFLARPDVERMGAALEHLHGATTSLAAERGEGGKIASEVAFYEADLFYYAQILYVFGFVLVAIGWLLRADAKLHRFVPFALMIPLALHTAGIAWRCYLRSRPPVSTLYETILFISAVAVLVALVIELLDRRRIAVAFAALLGGAGLFLAARFEAKDAIDNGSDTMPQLQAVLDTNFWLSTHVTTVTIGYSAGLLAAAIAHVYVLGRLFGWKSGDAGFYRTIARMTYGVICFGLLFSVVGTILGGVWANDSWGRFWGWDPKENGALMICLWELAILHSRMGGYVRDLGICAAAIFGGTIVGFSWWHVNLLGVGLHSYGFTHGLVGKLWIFYGIEWLTVLLAIWVALDDRARRKALGTGGATSA